MSEAVCGPSNPLQQFKQQTQLDRTLQQDRLATRHGAHQGFRSADRNGHMLDAEFEAFSAGAPVSDLPAFHPHELQRASPAPFATPVIPPWASDFQNLNISAPMPVQPQSFAPQAATPDWAADFRQHMQPAPRAQSSSPSPWAFQQRARYGMNTFDSGFSQPAFAERPMSKGKSAVREEVDDAAFARAFDMVAQEHNQPEQQEEVVQDPFPESMEETIEKALKDSIFDPDMVLGQVIVDNTPSIPDYDYNGAPLTENLHTFQDHMTQQEQHRKVEEEQTRQEKLKEDDALAATASELLERVKDNQTDKFQNSQFLVLMRKLKEREVRVDGDKLVETVGTTSLPWTAKRDLSPDSGYDSGSSTPSLASEVTFSPMIPEITHKISIDCDMLDDHRWDHWESPYT